MATIKSAKKAIKHNRRNRSRNQFFKTRMKSAIKKTLMAIESRSDGVEATLRECLQIIDKTAAKGVIKKQTAARKKSRLAIAVNKGATASKPAATTASKPKKAAEATEAPAEKKKTSKPETPEKTAAAKPAATKTKAAETTVKDA